MKHNLIVAVLALVSVGASSGSRADDKGRFLSDRPRSSSEEVQLMEGQWVPRAPSGTIYHLDHYNEVWGTYHYTLVPTTLLVSADESGSTLEELPVISGGYQWIFTKHLKSFPPMNLFQLILVHPFPRAGHEMDHLTAQEISAVKAELNRLWDLSLVSMMSSADEEVVVQSLQNTLESSELLQDQFVPNGRALAQDLYRNRARMWNDQVYSEFIMRRLPLWQLIR